jgi:hypothetical protein
VAFSTRSRKTPNGKAKIVSWKPLHVGIYISCEQGVLIRIKDDHFEQQYGIPS